MIEILRMLRGRQFRQCNILVNLGKIISYNFFKEKTGLHPNQWSDNKQQIIYRFSLNVIDRRTDNIAQG